MGLLAAVNIFRRCVEKSRCTYNMVMDAHHVNVLTIVGVISDMNSIIVIVRMAISVSIYRPYSIENDIFRWHRVFMIRNNLVCVLVQDLINLFCTPADKDCIAPF